MREILEVLFCLIYNLSFTSNLGFLSFLIQKQLKITSTAKRSTYNSQIVMACLLASVSGWIKIMLLYL